MEKNTRAKEGPTPDYCPKHMYCMAIRDLDLLGLSSSSTKEIPGIHSGLNSPGRVFVLIC